MYNTSIIKFFINMKLSLKVKGFTQEIQKKPFKAFLRLEGVPGVNGSIPKRFFNVYLLVLIAALQITLR